IQHIEARLRIDQRLSDRLGWLRLGTFVTGALAITVLNSRVGWPVLVIAGGVFAVAFVFLVDQHRNVKQSIDSLRRWKAIQQTHIARLKLDWEQLPPALIANDALAFDLDLTGKTSVHRLLNTAITLEGSRRLLSWLTAAASDIATITQRQELVKEL